MDETNILGGTPVSSTANSFRAKSVEWLLLEGDRNLVAIGIAGAFLVFFAVLTLLRVVPLTNTQALWYAYGGLTAGNLTLITVVVSINQLLLSRELHTPGELRTQIEDIIEYREDVEEAMGQIAPAKPLGFLRLLVEGTRQEAQRLGGFARSRVITAGGEELDNVVGTITDQMDRVDTLLTRAEPDTFTVISVMLATNYAEQIAQLRMIRATHDDEFGAEAHEAIDHLVDLLYDIEIARQYFKSIYLQQELSGLSRVLLYAGLPAEAITIAALLFLTIPPSNPESVVDLRLFVPVTLTIGLVPLAILGAFILRTATVTRLTAATLPFTTPEQER